MNTNLQLEEIVSWRFVTELWRRWPTHFDLIEIHPGGGQYDCLALRTRGHKPANAIDVNRGGSVHINKDAFGLDGGMSTHSNWMERMLGPSPGGFLDDIAHDVRLTIPKKRPVSTPATLTYRYISDFLTHSIGRLENWQCRNGFEDTSGYGGGVRREYFEQFPMLRKEDTLRHGTPICGCHEFNFWFLLKDEKPVLCLDTSGRLFRRDGACHDLPSLYKRDRRIWPLICETALDVMP
jgi:hypothetical protein